MTREDLEVVLSQLSGRILPAVRGNESVGVNHGLHFSGGEPFLNFELLLAATRIAEELKIPSIFVETNCFWCKTDQITKDKLKLLKAAGLKGILISVNPFYAEYVPFERTERCIKIGLEVFGDNVMVYQYEYYKRFKQLGLKERIPLEHFVELTANEPLTERVELFLMGRATSSLRGFYHPYPAKTFFNMPCQPPFLRNWHNHFDNYGNFMPGFCGGISLGCWRNLDELIKNGIDFERYPVLGFLITENMRGLFNYAENFGYREDDNGYLSKCDLCLAIRKFLVSKKNFAELKPKEFYQHLESQNSV